MYLGVCFLFFVCMYDDYFYVVLFLYIIIHWSLFVRDRVHIHAVDEVIDCEVLTFLWVTGIVVYDQICRRWFSNMLNVSVLCKFVMVKPR
jgi:hypothetical protein